MDPTIPQKCIFCMFTTLVCNFLFLCVVCFYYDLLIFFLFLFLTWGICLLSLLFCYAFKYVFGNSPSISKYSVCGGFPGLICPLYYQLLKGKICLFFFSINSMLITFSILVHKNYASFSFLLSRNSNMDNENLN